MREETCAWERYAKRVNPERVRPLNLLEGNVSRGALSRSGVVHFGRQTQVADAGEVAGKLRQRAGGKLRRAFRA